MENQTTMDELNKLLKPFIKEHAQKKDTVYEEDVESLIGFAKAFHVEDKLLEEVKANPDSEFWDFLKVIPEGVPPGQEDILEEDEED